MKLKIEGQRIEIIETELLVSDTVNVYRAEFEFDSAWDGYQAIAVFECRNNSKREAREVVIVDGSAVVPWETLLPGGTWRVGVYGTREGQRLPTIYSPGQYVTRGTESADPSADPTPGALEQVFNVIGDLSDLETEDRTTLVAAINEAAESGGGGTGDHAKLKNRDADDQHPISAITGLTEVLGDKQPKGAYLTVETLESAVDDALAEAKASGEFDGEDGTSVTVQNVTESTEDGGENVVTFSGGNTLTVKNGKTGAKGDTPQKGVDYFTEAEKNEIVREVLEQVPENTPDISLNVTSASVGQVIAVKAVDEDGRPTEWEAVDNVSRNEFETALSAYITDIDTLIGGD